MKAASAAASAFSLESACNEMRKVVAMSGAEKSKRFSSCAWSMPARLRIRMTGRNMEGMPEIRTAYLTLMVR